MNVLIVTVINIWKIAVLGEQHFINMSWIWIWIWIYVRYLNPKQVNILDIEQIKNILHMYTSYWNNTISVKLIEVKRFYQVCAVANLKNWLTISVQSCQKKEKLNTWGILVACVPEMFHLILGFSYSLHHYGEFL